MRVGIDEVGRGSLAGAVYACAFSCKEADKALLLLAFGKAGLRDSKQLTRKARESVYRNLLRAKKEGRVSWSLGKRSAKHIDKNGINGAIRASIDSALRKLEASCEVSFSDAPILLDGGLATHLRYRKQKTIIRGDETVPVIACASIIAKVARDRYMERLDKKYPGYGFGIHAGYGTKKHAEAIKKLGKTDEHRALFVRNIMSKKTGK